jgi:hypothetical protein
LSRAVDEQSARSKIAKAPPALTGEGVVGAVFSVIHTRLVAKRHGSLLELLNPLMAMIVLPYLGAAASQKELERPAPDWARASKRARHANGRPASSMGKDPLADLPIRLTYRTLRVLGAVSEQPGASNRMVSDAAGVSDQGQISKLLGRLEKLGLIHNSGQGQPHGEPNAWKLTQLGEEVQQVTRAAEESVGKPARAASRAGRARRHGASPKVQHAAK